MNKFLIILMTIFVIYGIWLSSQQLEMSYFPKHFSFSDSLHLEINYKDYDSIFVTGHFDLYVYNMQFRSAKINTQDFNKLVTIEYKQSKRLNIDIYFSKVKEYLISNGDTIVYPNEFVFLIYCKSSKGIELCSTLYSQIKTVPKTDVTEIPTVKNELIIDGDFEYITKIEVYNVLGILVKSCYTNCERVDVADLQYGIYFLIIKADNKIFKNYFIKL